MSTLRVNTLQDAAGTGQPAMSGAAKAWVNFNGTFASSPFTIANGGIRAAFNVSSVTDNGTGDYSVNFSAALADSNYAFVGLCRDSDGTGTPMVVTIDPSDVKTSSTAQFKVRSGGGNSLIDLTEINAVFFR